MIKTLFCIKDWYVSWWILEQTDQVTYQNTIDFKIFLRNNSIIKIKSKTSFTVNSNILRISTLLYNHWCQSIQGKVCITFWSLYIHKTGQGGGTYEPTHEIMALIAFRKLNLQTPMHSNPLGLHVWFLVRPFVYFHTLCVRTVKALARLAWAFAVRLCDKYHNLMSWLILNLSCYAIHLLQLM